MTFLRHVINAHVFFCRKSQHYVLGNWYEYRKWDRETIAFTFRFPVAYVKFMGWAILDGIRGYRYSKY